MFHALHPATGSRARPLSSDKTPLGPMSVSTTAAGSIRSRGTPIPASLLPSPASLFVRYSSSGSEFHYHYIILIASLTGLPAQLSGALAGQPGLSHRGALQVMPLGYRRRRPHGPPKAYVITTEEAGPSRAYMITTQEAGHKTGATDNLAIEKSKSSMKLATNWVANARSGW